MANGLMEKEQFSKLGFHDGPKSDNKNSNG